MPGRDTFVTPKAQARIAKLLEGLAAQPMNRDEAQCLLGCSKPTARRYLAYLRKQDQAYVTAWRSSERGRFAPVYALGNLPDVPEPAGMTRHERNAMQWRRIKADRDVHDRVRAVARVQHRINRVRRKPQPWFAALMVTP